MHLITFLVKYNSFFLDWLRRAFFVKMNDSVGFGLFSSLAYYHLEFPITLTEVLLQRISSQVQSVKLMNGSQLDLTTLRNFAFGSLCLALQIASALS